MRLLLRKCQVCYAWYSPYRSHCAICGALPIYGGTNVNPSDLRRNIVHSQKDKLLHFDLGNQRGPIELARGLPATYFEDHELAIAQSLID